VGLTKITALTVVYNTPDLLIESVGSFQQFYPDVSLLIMNNSDPDHECTDVVKEYEHRYKNIRVFNYKENQGHGTAVDDGIGMIDTDHIYYFDSDINMKVRGILEGMIAVMTDEAYGVGPVIHTDLGGRNITADCDWEKLRFLYLVVGLINRKIYHKYHPWTRYGQPILKALLEIHDTGRAEQLLKHFPVFDYVVHLSGGTRARFGDCEDIVKPLGEENASK